MKYKILAADDSNLCQRVIKDVFSLVQYDYELIFAHNGKEAVEKAIAIVPDLILMDVIMPEMNGVRAIEILRKNELTQDIPIIVLSSTTSLQSVFEAGANDFITKPFQHYELLMRARQALSLVEKIKKIKHQRDFIAQQTKDIIDDIKYSKRIQSAMLPGDEYIRSVLKDFFIYNMPRNIVSGDFYWVGQMGDKKVVAVADCTGHGISGAFMTMAGTNFLNEIINKNQNKSANEILFSLREKVMALLKQKGVEGEASDGMDIALIIIDEAQNKLQFSGANNPLYIIKNGVLEVIKGDRMPIGIHINFDKPFTNHEIGYNNNDILYMFSDGFADQFGGPNNKKFRYKQFRELLVHIHQKDMQKQKAILDTSFNGWKGTEEQVDDIMVMGIKL